MKKLSNSNISLAVTIVFIVVINLWGRYGNLSSLIQLYAETALPLALFIFGMYALICLKSKNIIKSLIIGALLGISALFYFNVIDVSKKVNIAYPVVAIFIVYLLITPFKKKESDGNRGEWSLSGGEIVKWVIPFAFILAIVLWYRYGNPYSIIPYPADTGLLFALFFLGLFALWQIRNKRIALSLIIMALLSVSGFLYFDVINLQEKRFLLSYPIMAMLLVWGLIQAFQRKKQEN